MIATGTSPDRLIAPPRRPGFAADRLALLGIIVSSGIGMIGAIDLWADRFPPSGGFAGVHQAGLAASLFLPPVATGLLLVHWHRKRRGVSAPATEMTPIQRRTTRLLDLVPDMVLLCDAAGTIGFQSLVAETDWAHKPDGLLGGLIRKLVHPDDQPRWDGFWTASGRPGPNPVPSKPITLRFQDGAGTWRSGCAFIRNFLNDPLVNAIAVAIRKVPEPMQAVRPVCFDPLTGLPGAILVHDRLQQALTRAERRCDLVGLLVVDLDGHGVVSDALGQEAGDSVLITAAGRLRGCVRTHDTAGRLEGSRFAVILELLSGEDDAGGVARAIAEQLRRPFAVLGQDVTVAARIGVAVSAPGQHTLDELWRIAESALGPASHHGLGHRAAAYAAPVDAGTGNQNDATDLLTAIDDHQLLVFYQPVVSLQSRVIREIEATIRWQHPTQGLLQPTAFMAHAENTGVAIRFGQWMLAESCLQLADWYHRQPSQPPFALSVRVAQLQLETPFLVADVIQSLLEAGLSADCLRLEVTAKAMAAQAATTLRSLWELRDLGVGITMVDFDPKQISVQDLKRLPLSTLKIDGAIVRRLGVDPAALASIQEAVALAGLLGLDVIAAGIENEGQVMNLIASGVVHGQGDHIKPASDASATTVWLDLLQGVDPEPLSSSNIG